MKLRRTIASATVATIGLASVGTPIAAGLEATSLAAHGERSIAQQADIRGLPLCDGPLAGRFPLLALDGEPTPLPTLRTAEAEATVPAEPAGRVEAATADRSGERFTASVHTEHDAVVVVKTSFHPRWSATVDGRPTPTSVVAPGLLAVDVPEGRHHVVAQFTGFSRLLRLALAGVGLMALAALAVVDRRSHSRTLDRDGRHSTNSVQRSDQPS